MRNALRRVNVCDIKILRSIVEVKRIDSSKRPVEEFEIELTGRQNQRVLRWFGHVEKMDEFCMARRVSRAEVMQSNAEQTEVRFEG